ncbi:fibroleukin-like [Musca autumnalis]|uniref:fibroleukin-like n=1 Tax=Musca autumnalis TaxID=221902 RepID=UPI003CF541B1
MLQGVYNQLSTLIMQTDSTNKNLASLSQRLDAIDKRQNEQEKQLQQIMQRLHFNGNVVQSFDSNDQWTTVLQRINGSVNFYRSWNEYKKGFGNPPNGDFFIGLEKLHELTNKCPTIELKIILRDWNNEERYALYDAFQIANESQSYKIKELGEYSGTAGDALHRHKGHKFTTYDRDNDDSINENCAQTYSGAWWFTKCYMSHLMGPYKLENNAENSGISWNKWRQHHSFKNAIMMIRPKGNCKLI